MLNFFKPLLVFVYKKISDLIPKNNTLILITADRYNENSRYLYEYLIHKKDLNVFWLTNNIKIKNYLDSQSLPCIYGKFKSFLYILRSKIIITSGTKISYLGISKNTIKYTLWHGTGIKQTEYTDNFSENINVLSDINYFDYINFTSKFTSNFIAKTVMKIPIEKIVINGYPRYDQLLKTKSHKEIENLKSDYINKFNLSEKANINSKFLIYTPTWRKNNRKNFFPLFNMDGFKIEKFNQFLKDKNYILFYTTHPNSIGYDVKQTNIIYLDYSKLPLFDLTNFMLVCDMLLNDYSTTALDFAILNKKQITLAFDYDKYSNNDGILLDNINNLPGNVVLNFDELIKEINIKDNINNEVNLIDKYYDIKNKDSCNKNYLFIKSLLKL